MNINQSEVPLPTETEREREVTTTALPSIYTLLETVLQNLKTILPQLGWVVAILFILQLPLLLSSSNIPTTSMEAAILLLILLSSIISGLFSVAIVHYLIQILLQQTDATLKTSVYWVGRHIVTIVGLMALAFGISVLGLLLLLIPALVFAVYNIFSYMVLIREKRQNAMDCIVRSTQLVYGAFWGLLFRVFAILLIVGLVLGIGEWFIKNIIVSIFAFLPSLLLDTVLLGVTSLVQVMVVVATITVLWELYEKRLEQVPVSTQSAELPTKRLRSVYWTAAVLGWLGFISLTLGLFVIFASTLMMAI